MPFLFVSMQVFYDDMQCKSHVDIIISFVDIIVLHVDIAMMHVDIVT